MQIKKSIAIEKLFTNLPFYDRFQAVKEAGFDYLEFGTWEPWNLPKIQFLLKEYELGIGCISGDKDYNLIAAKDRMPFLEYLKRSIEAAQRLNCQNLVLHSNSLSETGAVCLRGNEDSIFSKIASAALTLEQSARIAEKEQITLILEPVSTVAKPGYFMTTAASAGDIIQTVGSPNLKLLFDIYHMQLMEGNLTCQLKKYADILGYIHVGDVPGRFEPGTGEINYPHLKNLLIDKLHYNGFWGFELYPQTTMDACLNAIHSF